MNFIIKNLHNYLKKILFKIIYLFQKNVLRGLHYQKNKPQAKLISVIEGEILDVVVDLRKLKYIWIFENLNYQVESKTIIYSRKFCTWFSCIK